MFIIVDKSINKIKQTIDKNYGMKTNENELLQEVTEEFISKFSKAQEYKLIFKNDTVTDIKILKTWEEWKQEQPKQEASKTKEELQVEKIKQLENELIECKQSIVELTALASTVAVPKV